MATEVETKRDRLGWDFYPKDLSDQDLEKLRMRKALSSEIAVVRGIRTQIFFPHKPRRRFGKTELELDYRADSIHAVAELGTEQVAVGITYPDRSHSAEAIFRISSLGVLPQFRGNGIGTGLLAYLERQATENGAAAINLDSQDTCISFYEKLGYVMSSEFAIENDRNPMHKELTVEPTHV